MKDLVLDICHAGDSVYLSFGTPRGELLGSQVGPAWLVLDDSLYIDVTRHGDRQGGPVIVRLEAEDLSRDDSGAVVVSTAYLSVAGETRPLSPVVRRLGPAETLKGHVATVAKGALQGWATDPAASDQEVPIEVEMMDLTLIAMSRGNWHGDKPRAFSVPLPTDLPQGVPILTTLRAMPGCVPFARSPLFLTLTPAGWLLASPLRRDGSALAGEILLSTAPGRPVSVALTLADGRHLQDDCVRKTEVSFGGKACGFRFEGLSEADVRDARLAVSHDALDGSVEFRLDALAS